ncbi:MAG: ParB/RepB/Spo0J family partition protein [Ruminococcaceae bacterium]|nr:ParB/RepB/Spo0J family partition protein [Oscillospiraceae bacterium]
MIKLDDKEKIVIIPISAIDDFFDHPFQVRDDEEMDRLVNSIINNGVLTPVILRPNGERYEIISGHRRKYACKKIGIVGVPAIVRELTREEAIVEMVDSNLHREHILPSEKARAYKMKMDAMKRQGKRTDLTSNPMGGKLKSMETAKLIGEEAGESANQVRRYIRLTKLILGLLTMVDEGKIALRPAVEISYLTVEEQTDLLETIESEDCTPSYAQAIRMRNLSKEGNLDIDAIFDIMTEQKGNQKEKIKIPMERLDKFFPRGMPQKRVEDTIIKALAFYQKHLNKKREGREER